MFDLCHCNLFSFSPFNQTSECLSEKKVPLFKSFTFLLLLKNVFGQIIFHEYVYFHLSKIFKCFCSLGSMRKHLHIKQACFPDTALKPVLLMAV